MDEGYPAWSPDDTEIAFMCLHGPQERADLDVVDIDTGATRTVVAATAETNAWAPRWSPDGASLTFNLEHVTNGTFNGSVVATAPAMGGAVTVVAPNELAYAGYPDWSPDGTSIVFATYGVGEFPAGGGGSSNLYAVAPDGSGLRQITRYSVGGAACRLGELDARREAARVHAGRRVRRAPDRLRRAGRLGPAGGRRALVDAPVDPGLGLRSPFRREAEA